MSARGVVCGIIARAKQYIRELGKEVSGFGECESKGRIGCARG